MGIKTGAKDRLRIAGLFLYLTAKYGAVVFFAVLAYHKIYLSHGCSINCLVPQSLSLAIWLILGIIEWVLYGKIVWKYEVKR